MRKLLLCMILLTSCTNTSNLSQVNTTVISKSLPEIRMNFRIKDTNQVSRIKSLDAYLVSDKSNPSGSNVYTNAYKYQADITNGIIDIKFDNYPQGGPYYLALQLFNDVKSSSTKKNITEANSLITIGDNKFALSNNSVTVNNNNAVYSDSTNSLNVLIDLIPFNEFPLNITPQNGNGIPTEGVYVK